MSVRVYVPVLGKKIKLLRTTLGLSQEELGRKVGINQLAISRIERNVQGVRTVNLKAIASALGVSPVNLIGEEAPDFTDIDEPIDDQMVSVKVTTFEYQVKKSELKNFIQNQTSSRGNNVSTQ